MECREPALKKVSTKGKKWECLSCNEIFDTRAEAMEHVNEYVSTLIYKCGEQTTLDQNGTETT